MYDRYERPFFAFGGHNYARFLAWYNLFIRNIELTHPGATKLLENGAISVACSLVSGNLSMVDKTMEETLMRFAKSKSGAGGAGFSDMMHRHDSYQRRLRTTSTRTSFHEKTLKMCSLIDPAEETSGVFHHETTKSEIQRGEECVKRVDCALNGFLDPFNMSDTNHLYNIASGAPMSKEVETDVLNAEAEGRAEHEKFVLEHLQSDAASNSKRFYDPVKKLKLRNMAPPKKVKQITANDGKILKYKEQGDIAFQVLVKAQMTDNPISLEELMKYPITSMPHSLGTPDGYMNKTNKAALLHLIGDDYITPLPESANTLYIEDGNATVHSLKLIPFTFKGICLKILDIVIDGKNKVIFSTDRYFEKSIKSQERKRRAGYDDPPVLLLQGANQRKPPDFKSFLQNDLNKTALFKIMHNIWQSPDAAPKLHRRTVMIVVEGQAHQLVSDGKTVTSVPVLQISSETQEETDTRIILYLKHATALKCKNVVVHSPDSDVFHILLHYASQFVELNIFLETGTGDNRRTINISEVARELGQDFCSALLGLYVFTGEDTNCAFKGKGKVLPLRKLQMLDSYKTFFKKLGDAWDVAEDMFTNLESFVCAMYGFPR